MAFWAREDCSRAHILAPTDVSKMDCFRLLWTITFASKEASSCSVLLVHDSAPWSKVVRVPNVNNGGCGCCDIVIETALMALVELTIAFTANAALITFLSHLALVASQHLRRTATNMPLLCSTNLLLAARVGPSNCGTLATQTNCRDLLGNGRVFHIDRRLCTSA